MDPTTKESKEDVTNPDVLGNLLFEKAMKGKWDEVVNICTNSPISLAAGITRLEDTLLHLAVSGEKEETVQKLIKIISEQPEPESLLRAKNERGNTALHIAALTGNVAICKCIANVDTSLIGVRNIDGDTPLFTAVLFGKKQAFKCLYELCPSNQRYSCSRNTSGDTILHCAISGDHFDLALQIIKLYGEILVNAVNKDGATPLHRLADKPSAFQSGSRLGFFQRIIYQCMFVDEVEVLVDKPDDHIYQRRRSVQPTEVREGLPTYKRNPNVYPGNYRTCYDFCRLLWNFFTFLRLAILGIGGQSAEKDSGFLTAIRKIYKEKQQHTLSIQIMNKLLDGVEMSKFYHSGKKPSQLSDRAKSGAVPAEIKKEDQETNPLEEILHAHDDHSEAEKGSKAQPSIQQINSTGAGGKKTMNKNDQQETPILIAAKNGVREIVEKILELVPVAIHDVNAENKNVVLLAVENRQPHIYELLLQRSILNRESVFRVVDKKGNSAFHLAAKVTAYKPWLIPGEALQMQWEMKWFEFVTSSIPSNFVPRQNNKGKTPEEVFIKSHRSLVKKGGEWLTNTSQSYSVVAALIATVAFATSTTVPGGIKEDTGIPTLENKPAFHLFAISSLVALCFSVTALVMFLSILTSRHQERDFGKDLPMKLLIGLTSLFISIAAVLISFCSGHFFVIQNKLRYVAFAVYAATCLPVTIFAAVQFPLYVDLIHASFTKVPRRSYKATL